MPIVTEMPPSPLCRLTRTALRGTILDANAGDGAPPCSLLRPTSAVSRETAHCHFPVWPARAPLFFKPRAPRELLWCPFMQRPPMKDDAVRENALLEQARHGDREALGQLLEAQRTALHRLAQRQLEGRI